MPRGDRTGPMGQGAMTGRTAGFCGGSKEPGYADYAAEGSGMGFGRCHGSRGRGFGSGYGWRNSFRSAGAPRWGRLRGTWHSDPEMEKRALENRAEALQEDLNLVRKRLEEIESD